MSLRRRAKSERGQALLETAMTLPLLLFVSIGIVEFGRAYQTWQVLTNAAREGARVAVLPGTADASVRTMVKDYLEAGKLTGASQATVAITRNNTISIGAGTATASRVVVSYPFEFMVLQQVANLVVTGTTYGEALTMTASATMRNES